MTTATIPGKEGLTHKDIKALGEQARKIKEILSDGAWHDTFSLSAASGSMRIAARAWDLKQAGYNIESRRQTGRVWAYRLLAPGQGVLV